MSHCDGLGPSGCFDPCQLTHAHQFSGVGGSTALKDAENLAATIISANELGGDGEYTWPSRPMDRPMPPADRTAAGRILGLLPSFHREMIVRSQGFVKDATHRLHMANRFGWGRRMRNVLLRVMQFLWPLANWVSHDPSLGRVFSFWLVLRYF